MNVPPAKFVGYAPFPGSGAGTPDRVGTPPSRPSRPVLPGKYNFNTSIEQRGLVDFLNVVVILGLLTVSRIINDAENYKNHTF